MPRFIAHHKERKKDYVVVGLLFDDSGEKVTDVRLAYFNEIDPLLSNSTLHEQWVGVDNITLRKGEEK